MAREFTTIQIERKVARRLAKMVREKGDSFNTIIKRLMGG